MYYVIISSVDYCRVHCNHEYFVASSELLHNGFATIRSQYPKWAPPSKRHYVLLCLVMNQLRIFKILNIGVHRNDPIYHYRAYCLAIVIVPTPVAIACSRICLHVIKK